MGLDDEEGQFRRQENRAYRILVVDDERAVRNVHAEILAHAGYEVDVAADGALGWEALLTKQYDLVITDNSMPKVSGVELIEKILSAGMGIAIIMATGAVPDYLFTSHPRLRDVARLTKPFSGAQLLAAVKKILSSHREADAATPPKTDFQLASSKNPDPLDSDEAKINLNTSFLATFDLSKPKQG